MEVVEFRAFLYSLRFLCDLLWIKVLWLLQHKWGSDGIWSPSSTDLLLLWVFTQHHHPRSESHTYPFLFTASNLPDSPQVCKNHTPCLYIMSYVLFQWMCEVFFYLIEFKQLIKSLSELNLHLKESCDTFCVSFFSFYSFLLKT